MVKNVKIGWNAEQPAMEETIAAIMTDALIDNWDDRIIFIKIKVVEVRQQESPVIETIMVGGYPTIEMAHPTGPPPLNMF